MRKNGLVSHDDVRGYIGAAISKAQNGRTDREFADTIDASASAVGNWRNRDADMSAYFLVNAMKLHPAFAVELLASIGMKPIALTEAELDDREFSVALAALNLKQQRALIDGETDHRELLDMGPELDQVGDGVEKRRQKVRRLRSVA